MKSVLSAVRNLSKKAAASEFSQVESQLLKGINEFDKETFVQAASTFARAKQGSNQFWKTVQSQTMRHYNSFDRNEIADLALAIGYSNTPIDPAVESKLLASLNYIVEQAIEQEKQKNPYWESEFGAYIDSGLAPVMRHVAYTRATQNLDEVRNLKDVSEAPALVEFDDSYDKFTGYAQSKEANAEAESLNGKGQRIILEEEDGKIVMTPELKAEFDRFQKQFEKELQKNASNEKDSIWSLFKWK